MRKVFAYFLAMLFTFTSASHGSQVLPDNRAGPTWDPKQNTPTPTSTPTPSNTPESPPEIEPLDPEPKIRMTNTPTPDAVAITAEIKVSNVASYYGSVVSWLELEPREFVWEWEPELVLAVMAHESGGYPDVVSTDGYDTVGLMQVASKPWTARRDLLFKPSINIYWGIKILDGAMTLAEGDLEYALAYYNCSVDSVHNDGCGPDGGLNYSKDVREFWLPLIRERVQSCFEENGPTWYLPGNYIEGCRFRR